MGSWEKEKEKLARLQAKGKKNKLEVLSEKDLRELMSATRYERRKGRIRQK